MFSHQRLKVIITGLEYPCKFLVEYPCTCKFPVRPRLMRFLAAVVCMERWDSPLLGTHDAICTPRSNGFLGQVVDLEPSAACFDDIFHDGAVIVMRSGLHSKCA